MLLSDPLSALNGFVPFIIGAMALLALGYVGLLYWAFLAFKRGSRIGAWLLGPLAAAGVLLTLYLLIHTADAPGLFDR